MAQLITGDFYAIG
jgi:hypothetical protein